MDRGDDKPTRVTTDERRSRRDLATGERTSGRYEIASVIGKGGMGEVLSARDDQIGREVAIKRMKERNPSDRAIARFLREARIQGQLEHPSIVPVHEIGRDANGLPFFSMKRLSGVTLEEIIEDSPEAEYPLQRLLRAFVDVCNAIELAHAKGVIHRDLKPSNIMLGDYGEVYVLDWGVAKVIGEVDIEGGSGSGDAVTTAAGAVIGTVGFMSPEQARGDEVDHRTDIYALGCLLFEILTRQPLRKDSGLAEALEGLHERPSARTPERDIVPELDHACYQATELDPARRPSSARLLGEMVQMFLDGDRDLVWRREIGRMHLERAQAAYATRDEMESRRTAMREAGRALAIDPTNTTAADLLTRLMVEPPKEVPPEVAAAIENDDRKQFRNLGRIAAISSLAYLPFIPIWIYVVPPLKVVALLAMLLANVTIAVLNARGMAVPSAAAWIARAGVIVMMAWSFSPTFLAPGLAALFATMLALDARMTRPRSAISLALMLLLSVLGPAIAEHLGWLPHSIEIGTSGVTFTSPGLEKMSEWFLAAYTTALISSGVFIAFSVASGARALRRKLQLQTWQLRQLVRD